VVVSGGAGVGAVESSRRRPALALLAYLATRSRPVSVAEVTSALWPLDTGRDSLGEATRGTLASLMTKARKIVGDEAVVSVGGTYQLAPGLVSCDWSRLDAMVHAAAGVERGPSAAAAYRRALEVVRGTPFEGSLGDKHYEWVGAEKLDMHMANRVVDAAEAWPRSPWSRATTRWCCGPSSGAWHWRHPLGPLPGVDARPRPLGGRTAPEGRLRAVLLDAALRDPRHPGPVGRDRAHLALLPPAVSTYPHSAQFFGETLYAESDIAGSQSAADHLQRSPDAELGSLTAGRMAGVSAAPKPKTPCRCAGATAPSLPVVPTCGSSRTCSQLVEEQGV